MSISASRPIFLLPSFFSGFSPRIESNTPTQVTSLFNRYSIEQKLTLWFQRVAGKIRSQSTRLLAKFDIWCRQKRRVLKRERQIGDEMPNLKLEDIWDDYAVRQEVDELLKRDTDLPGWSSEDVTHLVTQAEICS